MKRVKRILFINIILFNLCSLTKSQTKEIGFRFTPYITTQPKVINPSPTKLYGESRISFDAGIDYTRFFKDKTYGLRLGFGMGVVDYNTVFEAPRNAFGIKTGNGNIYRNNNQENYVYNSLALFFVKQFNLKNLIIESQLGLSKKFYYYSDEPDGLGYAFNRATPYNFDDPNAGPPDLLISYPPINGRLHLDIPLGVGIKRVYSDKSSLTFSVIKNWNINPIAKGKLFIQAYDVFYDGEFSPRSSFLGVDIRYSYSLLKKTSTLRKIENSKSTEKKFGFKKTLFVELLGAGGLGSINADVRLQKNKNDGLGLRLGFGKGELFESDLIGNSGRYSSIPIGVNYIIGKRRNGLEFGTGISPQFIGKNDSESPQVTALVFGNIGYRFQPLKEGLVFRGGWNPYLSTANGINKSWIGLSLGYGFK